MLRGATLVLLPPVCPDDHAHRGGLRRQEQGSVRPAMPQYLWSHINGRRFDEKRIRFAVGAWPMVMAL